MCGFNESGQLGCKRRLSQLSLVRVEALESFKVPLPYICIYISIYIYISGC
jgi:hypothetical protein